MACRSLKTLGRGRFPLFNGADAFRRAVATVSLNGAKNAGLLAIQILGAHDESLRRKMVAYKEKMAKEVMAKAEKLAAMGWKQYLAAQKK